MKFFNTEKAPKAIGPYSQCVNVGSFYYLSGQTPIDPETNKLIDGDIKEQTARALLNIEAVLEEAGLSKEHVIKSLVLLRDMKDFKVMNEAYEAFFGSHKPARSAFAVAGLPLNARVEIEVIAYKE